MKKIIAILALMAICFSFAACGSSKVSDVTVDGETISATDYIVESLNTFMAGEDFRQSRQYFKDITQAELEPVKVTRVVELQLDGHETNSIDIHYLLIKADCQWGKENGDLFSSTLLVMDYDTGIVYHESMVDESWFKNDGSKESWTYVMLNGPMCGEDYDGGVMVSDKETRTELSKSEIDAINNALAG